MPGPTLLIEDSFELLDEWRKILTDDVPHDVKVDGFVPVSDPISQPNDFRPGNLRVHLLHSFRYAVRSFPDYLQQSHDGEIEHAVRIKVRAPAPAQHVDGLTSVIEHLSKADGIVTPRHRGLLLH